MCRKLTFTGLAVAFVLLVTMPLARAAENALIVFAAASTTHALTEIAKLYEAEGGKVALSFASSSTLAKQIENGAPADVYISADADWMQYLEERQLTDEGTCTVLLSNRLVCIVPISSAVQSVTVSPSFNISEILGKDGLLSVGNPAHVPVGKYAKAALENLKLWSQVESRIAPAKDVRAGLALVERAESPLGIVYASDAVISSKVRVAGTFPLESHPKIAYPVAALKTVNSKVASAFITFMSSAGAKKIWTKYGFEVQ